MPLEAITFDFWSTLVDGDITPERTLVRMGHLQQALAGYGHACSLEDLKAAFERAMGRLSEATRDPLEDVGPPGRWAEVARELGIPEGVIPYEVVETVYEDLTLDPLPAPMPHVRNAVAAVRQAGYRVGLICNTGMAGGRVLRQVLAGHGLLRFFDVTVFSDEFGYAKPHPSIFRHTLSVLGGVLPERALHVGDLEELDVEGARRAGVHAARYAPYLPDPVQTDADILVRDWRHFAAQLADFTRTVS
ncbi:MAG: HAD family hydrolase [Chloroflexota bacterium]